MLKKDKTKSAQSVSAFVQEKREKIKTINVKLQRLLDGYLKQDIEREIYRTEKAKLLSTKKSLEEKIIRFEQKQNDWLEPMEKWINCAQNLSKIAKDSDLLEKKVAAKEIFGSNLRLASRALSSEPVFPHKAARSAVETASKNDESLILEYLYYPNEIHQLPRLWRGRNSAKNRRADTPSFLPPRLRPLRGRAAINYLLRFTANE